MQEIERGDSGVRSTASVQSSLVMYPIWTYGNEAQRKKYLPKLASGEWMGSFGLTEPDHGSNPGGMVTNFKDMGDYYLLNGAKMWISNAPFCQFQLQQKKLSEMITEITKAQLLAWRLGVMRENGTATSAQISMAKRNNVDMALKIARDSRQMLGGMGISGEYSIMRHMMNLESVITYEGTHDIHLLITGLDITGLKKIKTSGKPSCSCRYQNPKFYKQVFKGCIH